ncbi:hypothetical protein HanIR_Chr14g0683441 [Helianthus annuus]|nr:hypothetical protein HanIR_Chr14g0683441 [Helianthus annuus]
MGFYSFGNRGSAKKILLNPPKSFHDWKQKIFFIREEVIPIAMTFRAPDVIEKEELPIPKKEDWYVKLTATPNRVFGENVLVAARMSDQWPADSKEVSVLKFQDRAFANPPSATEGAHIPNPRPLRDMTSAGKEILFLSSEESVGFSNGELSSWSNVFAGVLRDLGIDLEEKKKKPNKRKKVITLDAEVTSKKGGSSRATASAADKGTLRFHQSNLEDYVIISDSLEGLSRICEKKTSAAGLKSSGSTGSRNRMLEPLRLPSRLMKRRRKKKKKKKRSLLRS